MISVEQAQILKKVLTRFLAGDQDPTWSEFDTQMEYLEYLNDSELSREAGLVFEKHAEKNARCTNNHPREECSVPDIIEAIAYILDDYEETERLVKMTRYMLRYYLALSYTGEIVTD